MFEGVRNWLSDAIGRKSDPSYAISAQFFNPGAPVWSSKDYRTYVSQGYRKCGTVYTCINKISSAAAGIKWKLYTDPSMSREITSHALLDLWRTPGPRMGTGYFVEQCFGYWHLSGNCYLYANRPAKNAPPVELWPMRPDLMKVVAGTTDIAGYVYGYGTNRARDFDVEEIMHLKFPSYDDEFYGLSPIEVAMQLVDQQNEGNAWNTALMQNAGKPASVFFSKGYLTLEQRTQVRQELLKRYSGKRNAGMPMVLEADMTWQSMAMSPYELDWLQSRELNTREIAAIFDVAPELVGDSAGKTFANQKEAKQSLYTENVLPKMDRYVGHLNSWLVPMYDDLKQMGAWFCYDKKDIEVLAELYTAAQQAISEQADRMWMNGEIDLYTAQQMQGQKPDPNGKGIYRLGGILLRSKDFDTYAQQALQKPAAPPAPIPESLLNQPLPGQPALPAPGTTTKPKPGTTVTEVPDEEESDTNDQKPPKKPASGGKTPAPGKEKRRHTTNAGTKVLDLTTKAEKAAYLAQVEEQRASWEEKAESRLSAYFEQERKAVVKTIKAGDHAATVEASLAPLFAKQQDKLQAVLVQLYQEIGTDVGQHVLDQLHAATQSQDDESEKSWSYYGQKGAVQDFLNLFGRATLLYLLGICGTKVQQITDTTLLKLRLELAEGVVAGESIPQLASRVDSLYLDQIIPNRSTVIARTEVIAASNFGSHEAAKQSGLVLQKVWLATGDHRTRPDHAEADGQQVGMEEPFDVGGEQLLYPGDTSLGASAKETVQCRCTQYYARVPASDLDGSDSEDEGDNADDESADAGKARRWDYESVRAFLEVLV
jgi:HK97 family phage portal protein